MSDTPRMKAAQRIESECKVKEIWRVGCQLERELNAANDRIKRLEEVATDQRNRAEKWYIEEREDGDSVSIATTRAYFLAYTEIVREIRKAKEAKP